jgi:ATP:ADP antiporter, AAA family
MNLFVFFAILCAMAISGEYSITRPASNALFLTTFTSQGYPYVWVATVPLNLFIIFLYNRFLPKIGPFIMMSLLITLAMVINSLTGLFVSTYPKLIFLQFAWKDVYILLMFKQLWSMIHMTVQKERAKLLYGFIYGMGTVGSIFGSMIPGFFAVQWGSEQLLFFTIPVYLFLLFSYAMAYRRSGADHEALKGDEHASTTAGFRQIYHSPYLICVLLLVIFMQVSAALVEFQFNANLELEIADKDLRTEYCGKLGALINALCLMFQFFGGFLMLQLIGLKRSHLVVPLLLTAVFMTSWVIPSFSLISFTYAFFKSIDFSLFGMLREMLYIPLRPQEKYQAKAIIDVFAYRTSKALVSFLVLSLQAIVGYQLLSWINFISLSIFLSWLAVVTTMFRIGQKEGFAY